MYTELISIITPVIVCALVGYGWTRLKVGYDTEFISQLVMYVGAPCLLVATLSQVELTLGLIGKVGLAAICIMGGNGLFGWATSRWFKEGRRGYIASLVFGNNGNMGLPLCLFAFGEEGLALGMAYFVVSAVLFFSVGVIIMSNQWSWKKIVLNPVIHAAVISLILLITHWTIPKGLYRAIDLLGGIAIPLMLITLGVSLAKLKVFAIQKGIFFSVLKLGVGFLLGYSVVNILNFTGTARGIIILQACMPTAVFNYIFAEHYQQNPESVAGMVVSSTIVTVIALPVLLLYILSF